MKKNTDKKAKKLSDNKTNKPEKSRQKKLSKDDLCKKD